MNWNNFVKKTSYALADDNILVIGDFNAQIGFRQRELYSIVGQYSYGQRRYDLCINYGFQHKIFVSEKRAEINSL